MERPPSALTRFSTYALISGSVVSLFCHTSMAECFDVCLCRHSHRDTFGTTSIKRTRSDACVGKGRAMRRGKVPHWQRLKGIVATQSDLGPCESERGEVKPQRWQAWAYCVLDSFLLDLTFTPHLCICSHTDKYMTNCKDDFKSYHTQPAEANTAPGMPPVQLQHFKTGRGTGC